MYVGCLACFVKLVGLFLDCTQGQPIRFVKSQPARRSVKFLGQRKHGSTVLRRYVFQIKLC